MSNLREAALGYAGGGIAIFPVHGIVDGRCTCGKHPCGPDNRSAGKHPITSDGFKSATTDRDQVERWWTLHPNANIGTSTFDVLDVDEYKDGASETFARLRPLIAKTTPTTTTGGGGSQFFFKPGTLTHGNLGLGIDSRYAEANYVILPPSRHRSGSSYAWKLTLTKGRLDAAPDFPLSESATGDADDLKDRVRDGEIVETGRNKAAFRFACAIARWSDDEELILEQTQRWVERYCRDPHEVDVPKQVRGALKLSTAESLSTVSAPSVDKVDSQTTGRIAAPLSGKVVQQADVDTIRQPPALACEDDIFVRFRQDIRRAGLAGEERPAQIIYLCLTSRVLPWGRASNRPVSAIGKGTSSAGKSYTQGTVMKFFPPSAYFDLGSMSKRYLLYAEESLEHRFIVVPEWAIIADDDEIVAALRTLLSEGRLIHGTVDSEGNRRVARRIEKSGPTGLLMTTTAPVTDGELETRCLSFMLDDSREQTGRIFRIVAELEEGEVAPVDLKPWHALQDWLVAHGENRVVIPYVGTLADLMPTVATRLRRDFVSVLSLVRAHAVLHQQTRERDGHGQIIATIADYAAVHALLDDLVAEAVEASVSAAVRETVNAVRDLLDENELAEHVSVKKIAGRLTVGRAATYNRVRAALAAGYLVNVAKEGERGLKIALGEELPAGGEFLPSPDAVVQACPDAEGRQILGSTEHVPEELSSRLPRPVDVQEIPTNGRPLVGDDGYLEYMFEALKNELITEDEWHHADKAHRFIVASRKVA